MWTQIRLLLQEQSDPGPHSLSLRLQVYKWTSKTNILWLCALRVNKCEFSVYTVRIFMKCTHVCAAQTTYLFFTLLYIKPDFPCLAGENAEPRPDMNIEVAALTVSETSTNTSSTCHNITKSCPHLVRNRHKIMIHFQKG